MWAGRDFTTEETTLLVEFVLLAAVLLSVLFRLSRGIIYKRLPLPPGPKPLPLIGNVHQLPNEYQERTFLSWGRKFGDIVYVKLFNRPVIVTNTVNVARDLLDKRGAIYSDRPRFVLFNEVMDLDGSVPLLPYGDRLRKTRKWIHDSFSNAALAAYSTKQRREVNIMLSGILSRPTAYASHFARFTEALIMDIAYGHVVTTDNDKFIDLGEKGNHALATVGSAGSMLVDFFPILKYYPSWLPGGSWKRRAMLAAKLVDEMHQAPYDMVKSQLERGVAKPSFLATHLESHFSEGCWNLSPSDERDIRGAASTLFSAGTETMASTMHTFVLAMVLHPDIYRKAQKEMDAVVGGTRLPELYDRDNLLYLNSIIKETYRYGTLPFQWSTQDDEYGGYRISSKTLIIGNIWGISRDETFYSDPEGFRPERFNAISEKLEAEPQDPSTYVFGFGRRSCPGKDFADACIFMVFANIIATMNLVKAKDEYDQEITPAVQFESGFASRPKPFQCIIAPRSQQAVDLIRQQIIDSEESSFTSFTRSYY